MDLVRACNKALVVSKPKGAIGPSKKKVNVLNEEKYTEEVEKIIEQDFFPDLTKMKAQSDYLVALETNDLVKLRELQMKYSKRPDTGRSMYSSPATFETPEHGDRPPTKRPDLDTGQGDDQTTVNQMENMLNSDKKSSKQHLDSFLSKNTSEDNDSFSTILEDIEKKKREKHAWLFENEDIRTQEEISRLALPSMEQQAMLTNDQAGVDGWKYKTRNHVMYIPEGEDYSTKELVALQQKKPRKIDHDNTRFHNNPFNNSKNKESLKQAASEKANLHSGKIGHDGKEMETGLTPRVNGYGFVATPSPAPGVDESPLMTWGEIEGTPFQLEANETPLAASNAPAFRIPEVPNRDRLALELAERASKQHRDKKVNALKLASRLASPAPTFGSRTSTERINSLSPAAQRLFGKRIGVRRGTDKALRESYSPSPSHTLTGDITPNRTPKFTPKSQHSTRRSSGHTPSSTPGSTPGNRTPGNVTPGSKREALNTTSLTDNLLQIPRKRQKATDFF